jgi:hypothetical protein
MSFRTAYRENIENFLAFFNPVIELQAVFVGLGKIRNAKNYGRYDR